MHVDSASLPRLRLPGRLPALVELALWSALAVQAARLAWILLEPAGPVGAPMPMANDPAPPVRLAALGDPFHPQRPAVATASLDGYRLHGTRMADGGGAAIIAHDGRQGAWRIGDELAPGVVLDTVAGDHVLLRTASGTHRLELGTGTPPAAAAPRALPTTRPERPDAAAAPGTDAVRFMQQAGLQPEAGGGYRVVARGDDALMRQVGLQAGDVVLAVDGQPLSPERLRELQSGPADGGGPVQITVRRDGRTESIRLGGPE